MNLRERLKARALALGFDVCQVTDARNPASGSHLLAAIAEGRHGEMHWLARTADRRTDLRKVLPDVRSVVVLATNYALEDGTAMSSTPSPGGNSSGIVARYARHSDYHDILAKPLSELSAWLDAEGGTGSRSLFYVDTGPILERDLAQRAGIGFIGKHTGIVSRTYGNWLLLSEILTSIEIEPDLPEPNRCGSCTRCLDACPTGALPKPFTLDARRCIAYLTIELKGAIPVALRPLIGNRIFGCDDCLAACPWNRFARLGKALRPAYRADLDQPALLEWLSIDPPAFRQRFKDTPMERTKRRGLLRNVCVALGNVGDRSALPSLERAALDTEPLIVEHARWAMDAIQTRLSQSECGSITDSMPPDTVAAAEPPPVAPSPCE